MNNQNNFHAYVSEKTINYDVIIACIDTFFSVVERPTFIVVDRASIHTSDAIFERLEEWTERGLTLFELPTYSPELNLIEILWRFIKYQWLEIDAYSSWQALVSSVEKILKKFGDNYVINFA
jgi:transposase